VRDATEQTVERGKRIEDGSEGLTAFVELFPEAIIVHDYETIEYVNRAACDLFGADSPERIVGMRLVDLVHPDYRQAFSRRSMLAGESGAAPSPLKLKLQHLDGTAFYTEMADSSFIHRDKRTRYSVVRDLGQRERAEEELYNSEVRYRELVECANNIILRFDASFRISFLNRFALDFFDLKAEQVIGKKLMDVITTPAESSGRYVKSIIEDIFGNPHTFGTHENELLKRDGSRVWISWTNKPLFDDHGRFKEVLSIGNDITERKKSEDALVASREQLLEMGAELLIAEERERQRIASELHDIIGQDLAMAKIKLDSLFNVPHTPGLPRSVQEVRELIGEAIRELRSQIFHISPPILHMLGFEAAVESLCEKYQEDCGIEVLFLDDEKPKAVGGDLRGTLYQMVRELLLNVAKHARARKVLVSLEKIADDIEIRVEDDGIGFDPAQICQSGVNKCCLGLFSIRQRIEYLGGKLEIDAEPGRGAGIRLRVPLRPDHLDQIRSR
jgi:PAS domain S-box-containing protein